MSDKTTSIGEVVAALQSGMTVGIGGWGSRRKPMALVRAIANSSLTDLTVVSYGGPDVGLLVAAGKVRRVVTGFVSLDSIPLEPHFRAARQAGRIELTEVDEGMLQWACWPRLTGCRSCRPAGLGSDVLRVNKAAPGPLAVLRRRGIRRHAGAAPRRGADSRQSR